MESFDEKIKNKVLSFEYTKAPTESEVSSLFDQLDGTDSIYLPSEKKEEEGKIRTFQPFFMKFAAAVTILLIAGFSLYRLNDVNIYIVKGNTLTHTLPDGSAIEINADSEIRYNKMAWLWSRNVSLRGEAFFDVQKGRKFTVVSDLGSVQVLGTSFNVYARGLGYQVECISGRVSVNYVDSETNTVLSKGEGIVYNENLKGKFYNFESENRTDWRNGEFYFDNESIKNVLDEFSRQYDVQVKFDSSNSHLKYSGYFNNSDLEIALKMICEPLELTYQIKNDYIEIN